MSAHKSIDKICIIITALTLVIAMIFCNGQALGVQITSRGIGYENRIFDRSKVHTFDIVMNDWDSFIENCESEEYSPCNVVIDGEAVNNVGIRGKGNTSLSSVRNMNSSRYSFKIEFDQYDSTKSYHGLDKLCLNNIIQDNTYMKDYLAYTLMNDFGVDSPLCSYVYITVNGEDWGLYLAVESIEDSFLQRNYGSNPGELYKPDSMSFGGGRGNGMDFSMSDFMSKDSEGSEDSGDRPDFGGFGGGNMPDFGGGMPDFTEGGMPDFSEGGMPDFGGGDMPSDFDPSQMFGGDGEMPDFGGKGGFGMGSDDVKLKYVDDDTDSYSNIFNNAKTDVTSVDKKRLIRSLKALSEGTDLESTVDVEEVIRYFVVHNFLCNGDSYTGQMIHNYYLYEEDGQLSMIPWDYNLAYGSFQGGNASSSVNAAIDTPVSGDMSDRPMVAWIFDSEEYTEQYHELFSEFISSVDFASLVDETASMIKEYVEKDPTKFCTYEEFEKGVAAISQFCTLRAESVKGQLDGTIPSTSDGQKADSSSLIDTSGLTTSDMGTMGSGGGFGGGKDFGGKGSGGKDFSSFRSGDFSGKSSGNADEAKQIPDASVSQVSFKAVNTSVMQLSGGRPDFGGGMPEGFDPSSMPGDFDPSVMPGDFDPSSIPGDFDPSSIPDGERPQGFGGRRPGSTDSEQTEETAPSQDTENETAEEPVDDTSDGSSRPEGRGSDKDSSGESRRPEMGSFPGMGGSTERDITSSVVLLGVSALVLILGVAFALKFKR